MAPEAQAGKQPTPALLFDTLNAYQRTQALKAGIDLEVFTAIAEGKTTAKEIADRRAASEKGTRVLCDYLTIMGFLTKEDGRYGLTIDSAVFLDKRSPAYMGTVSEFMLSPHIKGNFDNLTESVKKGGSAGGAKPLEPSTGSVRICARDGADDGHAAQLSAQLVHPRRS